MIRILDNAPLGLSVGSTQRKCIAIPAAAVVSTLGSLAGGFLGSSSTSKTNATNLKIAREANEMNYKMFQEGNAFNAEQAQIDRDWNTASAIRSRLEQAGYNPQMVDSPTGQTSAEASSASANPAIAPSMQRDDSWQRSVDQFANLMSVSANSELSRQQAITEAQSRIARIDQMYAKTNLDKEQKRNIELMRSYNIQSLEAAIARDNAQSHLFEQQSSEVNKRIELADLDVKLKQYNLSNILPKQLEKLNQEIKESVARVEQGYTTAESAARQAVASMMQASAAKYNADTQRSLVEATADEIDSRISINSYLAPSEYYRNVSTGYGSVRSIPFANDYHYPKFFTPDGVDAPMYRRTQRPIKRHSISKQK